MYVQCIVDGVFVDLDQQVVFYGLCICCVRVVQEYEGLVKICVWVKEFDDFVLVVCIW